MDLARSYLVSFKTSSDYDAGVRLVTFETDTTLGKVRRLGALTGELVVDLQIAYLASLEAQSVEFREAHRLAVSNLPSQMEKFIGAGGAGLTAAAEALDHAAQVDPKLISGPGSRPGAFELSQVRLLRPMSAPNSLRDFIAFEDHARAGAARRNEELNPIWNDRPIYYKGNHRSLIGPDEPLQRPAFTKELDFELEIACIVGAKIIDADEHAADRAIFGYTIMNDWSARDVQRIEMVARLGPAKSKDFATSIGPCILTADEFDPSRGFEMTARVNGKVVCEANLSAARWTFPQMISFVSQSETVWPTDIYGSGTPFGGCMLDQGGPYLEPGDVVELEVQMIGVLRNQVIR